MGVDYVGVGGVGIVVDGELEHKINKFYKERANYAGDEFFDEVIEFVCDFVGIVFERAGSHNYGGEDRYYLDVGAVSYTELKEKVPIFLENLKELGVEKTEDDLVIYSDLNIY